MKILAIDACSSSCGAAVLREDAPPVWRAIESGRSHSVTLLPQIDEVMRESGLSLADLDYIAATVGPGSFTGIRICVSTAKGLAMGAQKGLVAVSTLEALAHNIPAEPDTILCPVLDARREQVYNALFRCETGQYIRLCPDRALSIETLGAELKALGRPVLFVGDGASLCFERLNDMLPCSVADPEHVWLSPVSVGKAALEEIYSCNFRPVSYHALTPIYLRMSQAERERAERLKTEEKQ